MSGTAVPGVEPAVKNDLKLQRIWEALQELTEHVVDEPSDNYVLELAKNIQLVALNDPDRKSVTAVAKDGPYTIKASKIWCLKNKGTEHREDSYQWLRVDDEKGSEGAGVTQNVFNIIEQILGFYKTQVGSRQKAAPDRLCAHCFGDGYHRAKPVDVNDPEQVFMWAFKTCETLIAEEETWNKYKHLLGGPVHVWQAFQEAPVAADRRQDRELWNGHLVHPYLTLVHEKRSKLRRTVQRRMQKEVTDTGALQDAAWEVHSYLKTLDEPQNLVTALWGGKTGLLKHQSADVILNFREGPERRQKLQELWLRRQKTGDNDPLWVRCENTVKDMLERGQRTLQEGSKNGSKNGSGKDRRANRGGPGKPVTLLFMQEPDGWLTGGLAWEQATDIGCGMRTLETTEAVAEMLNVTGWWYENVFVRDVTGMDLDVIFVYANLLWETEFNEEPGPAGQRPVRKKDELEHGELEKEMAKLICS